MKLIINTDGGARGNPGPAGAGVVIADERGKIIARYKKYLGETTNNSAEYQALILGLEEAAKISEPPPWPSPQGGGNNKKFLPLDGGGKNKKFLPLDGGGKEGVELIIRMDSELIVKQMQGKYKIKEPQLKIFAAEALTLLKNFYQVQFKHVPREQNKEADRLVNEAINARQSP